MGNIKLSFWRICLVLFAVVMAGCGGVEWFPEYVRQPTTPDPFSFTPEIGVALSTEITSDPITVSGLTGDSSPVSITGSAGSDSKYSINGAAATAAAGTVKNTDRVTVIHTSASAMGTSTTSTLTIGNVTGTFTSTTRTVATPVFSTPTVGGGFVQAFAIISSVDGIPGTHVVSIKDGNAQYSLGDTSTIPFAFTTNTQTVALLNNTHLFLRAPSSPLPVTTILTIDGVDYSVVINTTAFTVTIAPAS